ncbi:MAG: hypothetical protein IPF99_30480 [Deltaproteobacteria bacterium]|nr:hypothetical protein [Deltaproteobacteria bacterium]
MRPCTSSSGGPLPKTRVDAVSGPQAGVSMRTSRSADSQKRCGSRGRSGTWS